MKRLSWSAWMFAAGLMSVWGCSGEVDYNRPTPAEINDGLVDDARPNHTSQAISRPGRYDPPASVVRAGEREAREAGFDYTGSPTWRGGHQCSGGFLPGSERLGEFLVEQFDGASRFAGYNCRPIRGNSSTMSVHGTGRAVDVFIPTDGRKADNDLGDPVANYLIRHASELGIEFFIWDRAKWNIEYAEDRPYGGAHPHHDHLHIELTPEAARNGRSFPAPGTSSNSSDDSSSNHTPAAPSMPEGVSPNWTEIDNGGSTALAWESVSGATTYHVDMQHDDGGQWEDYYQWDTDDAGFRVWPQYSDREFRWRINACNRLGCSDWTDWRVIKVGYVPESTDNSSETDQPDDEETDGPADSFDTGTGLSAPTQTSPADSDRIWGDDVGLEWRDVSAASTYEVQLRYEAGGEWHHYYTWDGIDRASKTIYPVIDDYDFAWRVRACDGSDCSEWSSWSSFYFGG